MTGLKGSDPLSPEAGRDSLYGNRQAIDPSAPQYEQAIRLTQKLQVTLGDKLTDVTGHSMGGGEVAAISMLTGIRGTTFNAAGLNPATVTSRGGIWDPVRAEKLITNFHVDDEILTSLQVTGSIGSVPLALVSPVLGVVAASTPDAAGRQIKINAFDTSNRRMSWFSRNNLFNMTPLDLHGMDYVKRGMLLNSPTRP
jgi:hypothetical protein